MRRLGFIVCVFLGGACGTDPPIIPGDDEPLFPVKKGHQWTFEVRESDGDVKEKRQTITSTTANGAYVFETVTTNDATISVQRVDGTRLVRESEETFENGLLKERIRFVPPSVRVDLSDSTVGSSYRSEFVEEHLGANDEVLTRIPKKQTFTIEAADELVQVPAGQFRAVRIRRETEGGAAKTYWFVRNLGKIREVGGQTEELVDFMGTAR